MEFPVRFSESDSFLLYSGLFPVFWANQCLSVPNHPVPTVNLAVGRYKAFTRQTHTLCYCFFRSIFCYSLISRNYQKFKGPPEIAIIPEIAIWNSRDLEMGPAQSALILSLILLHSAINISSSSSDYTNLVFKGCADQNFQDSYKPTLRNLLDSLASRSSAAKFYKTTSGDASAAFHGLFQCRGDLSKVDCNNCVQKASSMSGKLCGESVAARVHLNGCYLMYEISGFKQVSGTELLYKVCGSTRASGAGFGDRLDMALGEIVKGVGSGSGGFYATGFQSVYVLGQCEGDLGGGDCVNCVKNAVDKAKSVCGSSISAQIYLQTCYISYTYYPNGVPTDSQSYSSSGREKNTQKTVAIVMGGLVGAGLIMACLLFAKSAFKKKASPYKNPGY